MAFTIAELAIVNQALDRINSGQIKDINDLTSNEYVKADRIYDQTRDSLLRLWKWNFAVAQSELVHIKTMVLDKEPLPDAFVVGDTITGISSGETAEIITVTSNSEYEIAYQSGDFTDGETLTNGDVEIVYYEGVKVTYGDETVYWYDDQIDDSMVCGTGYPDIDDKNPSFHYDYQYQLPSDFFRLTTNYDSDDEWTIQGKRLLSDMDEVELEYVRKITDPADFDPMFTEILILQLALKLLPALGGTQTITFRQDLKQDLAEAVARAKTINAADIDDKGRSDWNEARFE